MTAAPECTEIWHDIGKDTLDKVCFNQYIVSYHVNGGNNKVLRIYRKELAERLDEKGKFKKNRGGIYAHLYPYNPDGQYDKPEKTICLDTNYADLLTIQSKWGTFIVGSADQKFQELQDKIKSFL